MLYDVNLMGDQQSVCGIFNLEKPISKLSYTASQPKQVVICVCHELSIKLLNLQIGGNLHVLQEVEVFMP